MRFLDVLKIPARVALAGFMGFAGIGHFRDTESFLSQVPPFLPAPEWIVWISGVVEIAFAILLLIGGKYVPHVGWTLAAFFVVIFPGNISQALTQTSAFGLETDASRYIRLLFQPVLIAWALWSTNGWRERRGVLAALRSRS